MAQAIVVSALKKQIISKKNALESALKKREELGRKYNEDDDKSVKEYKQQMIAWEQSVIELARTMTITKDNAEVTDRSWRDGDKYTVTLSLVGKKLPKRPVRKDVKWSDYQVEIPTYYDSYHRPIESKAVLAHWTRSLEMLEVLPTGTVEVAVKDYNFLTKF
jgi:hypothetical protein